MSTTDFSVVQRIDVPVPVGIDQMPDGKTIIVGTETQGIYLINEDTFAVQSFFISTPSPIGGILLPIIPAAMANGKVLFIGLTPGRSPTAYYLEGELYEWDPTTNSFTAPSSSISSATTPVTVHLARSGDHKFAIFDQYGGGVFLNRENVTTAEKRGLWRRKHHGNGATNHHQSVEHSQSLQSI